MDFTLIWNTIIVFPLVGMLQWLNGVVGSFGWAIILFTLAVKVIMAPLTVKQFKTSRAMQELQPQIAALQKKYGSDKQLLAQEQQKLYQQAGVSPTAGCGPMLLQFPIMIGLYWALMNLSSTPEFASGFLWISNLAAIPTTDEPLTHLPDFILPVLMVVTGFIQQLMMTPVAQDKQAQSMNSIMMFMPLMFGFIAFQVPAGLTLYWVAGNIFGAIQQFFISGWGQLAKWLPASIAKLGRQPVKPGAAAVVSAKAVEDTVRVKAPVRPATAAPGAPVYAPPTGYTGVPGASKTVQSWDFGTHPEPPPDARKPKKGK